MANRSLPTLLSNATNTSASSLFLTELQFNVFFSVNTCLCVVASTLYILLLIVIIQQSGPFSGSRLLIVHQLIAEILMVTVHWPVWIATVYEGQMQQTVVRSVAFCRHYFFWYIINLTAVHWGFVIMAVNRVVAVVFPHQYKKISSIRVAVVMIGFSWIVGFAIDLYAYLGIEGGFFPLPPYGVCNFAKPLRIYAIASIFRTYLPLTLTGALYLTLFAKVTLVWYRQKKTVADQKRKQADDPKNRVFKRRVLLAKLLFVVTIIHCVSFNSVPFVMTVLPRLFQSQLNRQWIRVIFFSGFLSPPLVFFAMNQECRQGVKKLICLKSGTSRPRAFSSIGNGNSGAKTETTKADKTAVNDTPL